MTNGLHINVMCRPFAFPCCCDVSFDESVHLPRRRRVAGIAAALLLAAGSSSAQSTALVGATVIDGTGRPGIPNAVVVVTRDRVACVGTAAQCPVPSGAPLSTAYYFTASAAKYHEPTI